MESQTSKSHFKRYYEDYVTCDWCGKQTRGRIWEEEPDVVKCGACHKELENVG